MKRLLPLFTILFVIGIVIASKIEWKSDLIFSHKYHSVEAEAECSACHENAETSTSGKDDLLPEMETCYNCHDEDMDCASCHKQPDDPIILPRIETFSLKFNHKLHFENEISCTICHAGIQSKDQVESQMHLPDMDGCMSCHVTPETIAGCYACHETSDLLKPADHEVAWMKNHGMVGEAGSENCNSCHTDNYCVDCHKGENLQSQTHPPEFLLTHSMSYMVRESDCASCHESKQFCIGCHMYANQVYPMDHREAGWSEEEIEPLHAEAARIDYDRCTVCHQGDETACIQCHN